MAINRDTIETLTCYDVMGEGGQKGRRHPGKSNDFMEKEKFVIINYKYQQVN